MSDISIGINEHYERAHCASAGRAEFLHGDDELIRRVRIAVEAKSFTEDATAAGNPRRCVRVADPRGFLCGLVYLVGGETLRARPARHGEPYMEARMPQLNRRSNFGKSEAAVVDVYLYSAAALAEGDEASTSCDWEIVGLSARDSLGEEPAHPISMMRNQLGLPGGTRKSYTPEEWAASVQYWSCRAFLEGDSDV